MALIQWFQINPDCTPKKRYLYNNAILDKQKGNLDHSDEKYTELQMYLFNVENRAAFCFSKYWNALHVYLFLMISNCNGESFSKLRRIKNYLRSSI